MCIRDRDNPGWEQLLQQYQASDLWASEETNEPWQTTEDFGRASGAIDNTFDQTMDVYLLQRSDSERQFFMEPEPLPSFDFNVGGSDYQANRGWAQ